MTMMTTVKTMNELTQVDEASVHDTSIPDESLTEIAQVCPSLDDRQRRYVYWRVIGTNPAIALKNAGYAGTNWRAVETRPKVREAISRMVEFTEPEVRVTQKTILNIAMEAIDLARTKSQAANMLLGAKLLAEVTGNLAASRLDINSRSQVDVNHTHSLGQDMKTLQQLPRSSLERLLELDRVLPTKGAVIEDAEYEVVPRLTRLD